MKRLIIPIISIVLIILITLAILLVKKHCLPESFPHFKQAIIKYNGTVYGVTQKETSLFFEFLDENKSSEMENCKNIKDIYFLDENSVKTKAETWKIDSAYFEGYVVRTLYMDVIFNESGVKKLTTIVIKYNDDVEEKFSIGNLKVVVGETMPGSPYIMNCTQDLIMAENNLYCNFAGVAITLGNVESNIIEINKIQLGMDGIGIDNNGIKVIYGKEIKDINMNEIQHELNYPKRVETTSEDIDNIKIDFNNNHIVTLIIPFTIREAAEKNNSIYIFNPKLTFKVGNSIEEQIGDTNIFDVPRMTVSIKNSTGDVNIKELIEGEGR